MDKKIFSCIVAFVSALLISCGVFASTTGPAYRETAVDLPKSSHYDVPLTDFIAGPGGYINYYITEDMTGLPVPPTQFQSQDYGKTWKQVDMRWYEEIKKLYPDYGESRDIYTADDGTIYCIVRTERKSRDNHGVTEFYNAYAMYKYASGKVEKIPNISLGEVGGPVYTIENVAENGDICILQIGNITAVPDQVSIYDAKGSLKKVTPLDPDNGFLTHCAKNALYGIQSPENGRESVVAFDIETGRKTVSIPFPIEKKKSDDATSIGVSKDGTIYVTLSSGLYQCKPGGSSFSKLLDGKSCRLGKNALTKYRMFCSEEGVLYLDIRYYNDANEKDPNNFKQAKLYRYAPV